MGCETSHVQNQLDYIRTVHTAALGASLCLAPTNCTDYSIPIQRRCHDNKSNKILKSFTVVRECRCVPGLRPATSC